MAGAASWGSWQQDQRERAWQTAGWASSGESWAAAPSREAWDAATKWEPASSSGGSSQWTWQEQGDWEMGNAQDAEEWDDRKPQTLLLVDPTKQLSVWCSSDQWCEFDFASHGVSLHCHLRRPQQLGRSQTLVPLLLFLHSASYEPVQDLFPEGDAWLDEAPGLEPLFILCPRCPADYYWLLRGNSWEETGGTWVTDDRGFCFWEAPLATEMAGALLALVREVAAQAPVDPCRILLSGASMGGHGCLELAAGSPDLFAALAPVAPHLGADRLTWAAWQLRDMPVWAFHGKGDFCCPFEDTEALVRRLGPRAGLTTYEEGRGEYSVHNSASVVAYVEHGRSLLAWMLRQPPRWAARRRLWSLQG